ncbi:ComF family protein [Bathymodiolus heckerae thiotrophic gill symbiont]|uniref:ComF family protein n=1 Tax=Bathymodiolus heckerae thiotrophic gill symbiont TaxID=1052212 RepID=UPI002017906F|nr:ComF family protein [Bathymodiolus heckerae thiotrophic gill symbiont]
MQFNTVRSEAGEALFQLKYRADFSKVFPIAQQMNKSFSDIFPPIDFIIPMPSSRDRFKQLVIEIAKEFSRLKGVPFYGNLLVKTRVTLPVKDIAIKDDKISTLMEALFIHDILNEGLHDVLIIDDLFDTGSSLEAATKSLQNYSKIRNVYVATVTRKR